MIRFVLRRRLNKICEALGITPYPWQVDFVLSERPAMLVNHEKCSGKTTAVILRALVYGQYSDGDFSDFVFLDPDARRSRRAMLCAYEKYRYEYAVCLKARAIPEHPPLRSSMEPWYDGHFRDKRNTDAYWRAVAEVRREYEHIREARQHGAGIEI